MRAYKKVLVGTHGSANSMLAVDRAAAIAVLDRVATDSAADLIVVEPPSKAAGPEVGSFGSRGGAERR